MFQTVPGGLGKWGNTPSGKVPQSLIAWEKSEKAVLGEERGADGQTDFSAHLTWPVTEAESEVSASQLCALPKPAPDAPESPRSYSVFSPSWPFSVLCCQGPLTHITDSSDCRQFNQTLLFLPLCLCRATKAPCSLKAVHLWKEINT